MIDPGRSDGGSASVSDSLRHGGTTRPGPARGTRAADVAVGFRLSLPVLPDDAARLVVPAASSSAPLGPLEGRESCRRVTTDGAGRRRQPTSR